ncbi:hypothetical protein [Paractinoplanes atraurantiacus]|uniref:Uncharacterized protein n=1 Tax=Paractinoplanes atraurantiacus TaxID=1036182 RepID=A0A285H0E8_9ACTN|nr:hypothetical protein [Actinoplanes atraurantiacus]SNY29178.1 hypothetical protein SAMN05421748_103204 [Actinoplanes atraurantiacus]
MKPVEAIVFVLSGHLLPDADRCIRYCLSRGYNMIGVVRDDWRAAMEMLADGRAEVLVVADPQHLDPNRTPRVEYVSHAEPAVAAAVPEPDRPAGATARQPKSRTERTRVIRRTAAR